MIAHRHCKFDYRNAMGLCDAMYTGAPRSISISCPWPVSNDTNQKYNIDKLFILEAFAWSQIMLMDMNKTQTNERMTLHLTNISIDDIENQQGDTI